MKSTLLGSQQNVTQTRRTPFVKGIFFQDFIKSCEIWTERYTRFENFVARLFYFLVKKNVLLVCERNVTEKNTIKAKKESDIYSLEKMYYCLWTYRLLWWLSFCLF